MLFKSFASEKCHLIQPEITCPKCTGCKILNYFPTFLHLTLFSHKSSKFAHVAAVFSPLIGWEWRHLTNERPDIPQVSSPRPQSLTGSQARRAQPSDIKWALKVMSCRQISRYLKKYWVLTLYRRLFVQHCLAVGGVIRSTRHNIYNNNKWINYQL